MYSVYSNHLNKFNNTIFFRMSMPDPQHIPGLILLVSLIYGVGFMVFKIKLINFESFKIMFLFLFQLRNEVHKTNLSNSLFKIKQAMLNILSFNGKKSDAVLKSSQRKHVSVPETSSFVHILFSSIKTLGSGVKIRMGQDT